MALDLLHRPGDVGGVQLLKRRYCSIEQVAALHRRVAYSGDDFTSGGSPPTADEAAENLKLKVFSIVNGYGLLGRFTNLRKKLIAIGTAD
jgi:hypothetical protein